MNKSSQQFQYLYLEWLEVSSIYNCGLCEFRWLLTFLWFWYFCQVLSHSCQKFNYILMRSDSTVVYISMWFREWTLTQQLWISLWILSETQEMIKIWNLTEVRADWVQEQKLQVNISFNQILSWFIFTVQNIKIFLCSKFMESILNNISVNHFFISLFNSHDWFLHLSLEYFIKEWIWTLLLFSSHWSFCFNAFVHKHLECWQLKNGSVSILFGKVSIVNWITSQSTS